MAAVLAPHPQPRPAPRPTLRLVTPCEPRRDGFARRPSQATYWRRRALVLAALVSLLLAGRAVAGALVGGEATVTTGAAPVAGIAAPEATPAPAADQPAAAPASVYVVRPGDTVWSIAQHLRPDGDVRALVDELTERAGGSALQAGQRIPLDGLGV
jgi:hypothetical protein